MKKYIKAIAYAIIYILLFMLFRQQIGDLLWDMNHKWFVDCDDIYGGVLIMALCSFIITSLATKYRYCIFGHHLLSGCMLALFIYIYFRWGDTTFNFWYFRIPWTGIHVVYVDCIILVACAIVAQQYYAYKVAKRIGNNQKDTSLLMKDDPIREMGEDILGYKGIVESLLSDLEGVNLKYGSFSVGITGEWGMGKSSLFFIFTEMLKENKQAVVYNFNPRSSASIQDIQQDFFDGFANALAPYHSGVHRVMKHYQEALQIIDDNWISKLLSLFSSWTVTTGKDRINEIIRETHKHIFVLVDDLDRLTAPEILEVMKLIDRNGDFVNTIFITAYDKSYVNDVLRHHLKMGRKSDFTDKYFSHEYALPVQKPENLNKLAKQQIEKSFVFEEGDVMDKGKLLKQWNEISEQITDYLHSLRHVKRFMNILLSRYVKVRNDVRFKDFAYLTLLRYKDIGVYNAIIEGKLITQGNTLTDTNSKVYYLKKEYADELKKVARWADSDKILNELFKQEDGVDVQIASNFQRLRFVSSMPNYYYDYKQGEIYFRDLIRLYQVDKNEDAIALMKELLQYDEEKKECSTARYQSIEDFLIQRPVELLSSLRDVKRLVLLLPCLMKYSWRTMEVEVFLTTLLQSHVARRLERADIAGTEEEYIIEISAAFEESIKLFPLEMALVLLKVNYGIIDMPALGNDYFINQRQIIEWAEWCQKLYIHEIEDEDCINAVATVIEISKIYFEKDSKQVTKSAQAELVAYITKHAKYFSTYICAVYKPSADEHHLMITYNNNFNPKFFFPYEGKSFSKWIEENVDNVGLKNILLTLEKTDASQLNIDLEPGEYRIGENDYNAIWRIIKRRKEEEQEQRVLVAMSKHIALSVTLLSKETGYSKKTVRKVIERLVKKKTIDSNLNRMADDITPFELGDFVMYKGYDQIKDKIGDYHSNNVFKILDFQDGKYKLGNIEGKVGEDDIEAIPIDGVHDRSIYYDPIVAASNIPPGGKIPVHRTDYSYYMDKFENCYDVDKRTYAEVVRERGYQFVHEVQHWLNDEFDRDGLKIRW